MDMEFCSQWDRRSWPVTDVDALQFIMLIATEKSVCVNLKVVLFMICRYMNDSE
jgi:hypothetical protein